MFSEEIGSYWKEILIRQDSRIGLFTAWDHIIDEDIISRSGYGGGISPGNDQSILCGCRSG
jgi:hypothetical protein